MLYTFSRADYPPHLLTDCLNARGENDALLLWQDGVLLALKYPELFSHCYILAEDVAARNLLPLLPPSAKSRLISIEEMVLLTERYFPQLAY
ncbi:tRNA 2-thiouridine synthesizing protein B [Mesocricetibacter intestinalis]|uniref:tRNA 2-thiouridine synthesizing protein B n=1 Tax=Mesocricetibacter intestinalis TaxID=1521930 RepID=A0A4R6VH84_9PAST|nr:DsrH/TusB family sulfur metabolism protein [Mesocricetibacter intestinalis]TDQ57578.1 tRNA 2-thiouridine synthesizing protein B [Mesocricetibacter intestinalis]